MRRLKSLTLAALLLTAASHGMALAQPVRPAAPPAAPETAAPDPASPDTSVRSQPVQPLPGQDGQAVPQDATRDAPAEGDRDPAEADPPAPPPPSAR